MRTKSVDGKFAKIDPMTRFLSKILIGDECWPWVGMTSTYGYGVLSVGKRWNYPAHRFSYEQFVGVIPEGSIVRRTCESRICVRPDHLFVSSMPVTERQKSTDRHARRRVVRPDIYKVRHQFNFALHNGKIVRPDHCALCGTMCTPHGHHIDYSRPYCVAWLCRGCHSAAHRKTLPIIVDHLAIDYAT